MLNEQFIGRTGVCDHNGFALASVRIRTATRHGLHHDFPLAVLQEAQSRVGLRLSRASLAAQPARRYPLRSSF